MEDISEPTCEVLLNGKIYLTSRLSDKQISELDRWVRGEYIANIRESLPADMLQTDKDAEMRKAALDAAGLSIMSATGVKMIATIDGMSRLAWQSLRKNHPTLSYEDFKHNIFSPTNEKAGENLSNFNKAFQDANVTPAGKAGVKKGARRVVIPK